ncbi:putative secreted protein [Peptoniphilus sp. ING2-D1G]|nr:putative secreted protein [Peptoniphilus sp. ING2-D1G]
MKKLFKNALVLIAVMALLSGCSLVNTDFSKIETPLLAKTPMDGKWTISKIIFQKEEEDFFAYKDFIGNDVLITSHGIIADDTYLEKPTFRARRIESKKYLEKRFNMDDKKLNISGKYLTVLDVYSKEELIYEMLKVDEENAFIYKNGIFFKINKVSDEITEKEFEQALNRIGQSS